MILKKPVRTVFFVPLCFFLLNLSYIYGQWNPRPDPEGTVDFNSSNLPIIIIDTNGGTIVDDPRIIASMKIIDNGPGITNTTDDSVHGYNGRIAIELRGSSSASYAKKQYRLETQDSLGENLNLRLLDMPRENDWILNGPYDDESLIRNVLAYRLSNKIGRYASRTRFCELVLNGDYRGVYVLMEKIKRDNDRVDIKRMDADDVAGDSLTGGYLIKIDKDEGENVGGWTSAKGIRYQYDYPKADDIQPEQKEYIKQFMNDFETAMVADWSADDSYLNMIDYDSFVDHFILNEFCKNVDAYRISAYMYKQRDSNGGKLFMGPIWDFNLSMAKAWFREDQGLWEGWQIDYRQSHPTDGYQVPFWWEKLAHTPYFKEKAEKRWFELRQTSLNKDSLYAEIDALVANISDASERNFEKWPGVLADNESYNNVIQVLKTWIEKRLTWIDENIGQLVTQVERGTEEVTQYRLYHNYPNPFNPKTVINYQLPIRSKVELSIYNMLGQKVTTLVSGTIEAGFHQTEWEANGFASGIYFYRMQAGTYSMVRSMLLIK